MQMKFEAKTLKPIRTVTYSTDTNGHMLYPANLEEMLKMIRSMKMRPRDILVEGIEFESRYEGYGYFREDRWLL